jgi:Serine/threonine protein kinase
MYRRLPDGTLHFVLTDFGIAKLREQSDGITATGASMLTYDYASPEQFNQSKTVSTPTDYYSLGVVLYECLTGRVPFEFEQGDLLYHINRVISCPVPEVNISFKVSITSFIAGVVARLVGKKHQYPHFRSQ